MSTRIYILIIVFCFPVFSTAYAQNKVQSAWERVYEEQQAKKKARFDANMAKAVDYAVDKNKSGITQIRPIESNPDAYILTIDRTEYLFTRPNDRDNAKNRFVNNATKDAIAKLIELQFDKQKIQYENMRKHYEKTFGAEVKQKVSSHCSVRKGKNPKYKPSEPQPPKPGPPVTTTVDVFPTVTPPNTQEPPDNGKQNQTVYQKALADAANREAEGNYIDLNSTPRIFEKPNSPRKEGENTMEAEMRKRERIATDRNIVSMKSKKDELMAKYDELFANCIKTKSDCIGQFKPLRDEIETLDKMIDGRKEWLERLENMSQEKLMAEEKYYKKLSDMADLAQGSYANDEDKDAIPDIWNVDKKYANIIDETNDNIVGFQCELFYNEETDQYVLSFRGTEFFDRGLLETAKDVGTDFVENFIKVPAGQTETALKVIEKLKEAGIPLEKLELTGHSLGGRLAAEAAVAYGLTAYTFNAADVSLTTRKGTPNPKANIVNTVSANDPLTASTYGLGNPKGGRNYNWSSNTYSPGNTHVIKDAYGGHSIALLRQVLKQRHNDVKSRIK